MPYGRVQRLGIGFRFIRKSIHGVAAADVSGNGKLRAPLHNDRILVFAQHRPKLIHHGNMRRADVAPVPVAPEDAFEGGPRFDDYGRSQDWDEVVRTPGICDLLKAA